MCEYCKEDARKVNIGYLPGGMKVETSILYRNNDTSELEVMILDVLKGQNNNVGLVAITHCPWCGRVLEEEENNGTDN